MPQRPHDSSGQSDTPRCIQTPTSAHSTAPYEMDMSCPVHRDSFPQRGDPQHGSVLLPNRGAEADDEIVRNQCTTLQTDRTLPCRAFESCFVRPTASIAVVFAGILSPGKKEGPGFR